MRKRVTTDGRLRRAASQREYRERRKGTTGTEGTGSRIADRPATTALADAGVFAVLNLRGFTSIEAYAFDTEFIYDRDAVTG
jgi:hypothetical protein